jgi:RsiW-degrading membrane proteinase PrsW (M82 family)
MVGAAIGAFVSLSIGLGLLTARYRNPFPAFCWIFPVAVALAFCLLAFTSDSNEAEPWAMLFLETVLISWTVGGVLALVTRRKTGDDSD